MLKGGIWMLEVVFGCPKGAFEYAGYKDWAAEAEGIRIPKNGIRMLKIASECQRKAFGYAVMVVSEC